MIRPLFFLLLAGLFFPACSTLKGWFTAQGQLLTRAQTLADQGHPLGASSLALEALVLEPEYREARELLDRTFLPGQEEFRSEEARLTLSSNPERWDQLHQLYSWQAVLARSGAAVSPQFRVDPVDDKKTVAAQGAARYHLSLAEGLLKAQPGPRQARKALAEGRKAEAYDPAAPGLAEWMEKGRQAAAQKLLVVPFFYEGSLWLGPVSGPLASMVSEKLVQGDLPELTSVFSSDRLVTLPNGGLARLGLISQPDALVMAAEAGQNLILMGQITRAQYQEPQVSVKTELRERRDIVVDPAHPEGSERLYKAVVTTKHWTTSVSLTASFTVIEGPTSRDLLTAVREVKTIAEATITTFVGEKEALTTGDIRALEPKQTLDRPDELWTRSLEVLADQISAAVKEALR